MIERQFSSDDLPSVQAHERVTRSKAPSLPPSLEMRVFRGVFYALLAFSLLSVVGYGIRLVVAAVMVRHMQEQVLGQIQQAAQVSAEQIRESQVQQAAQEELRQQQAAYERSRYDLADNQKCVGGAVVQVDGTTYTQVGSIQYPVHCVARRADRPLR